MPLKRLWSFLTSLCFLAAVISLIAVSGSRFALSRIQGQMVVVSARPQVEDAFFKLAASHSRHLLYVRGNESFAQTIRSRFPATNDSGRIEFYEARDHAVLKKLSLEEGTRRYDQIARLEWISTVFPNLAVAICVGLGTGILFPGGLSAVAPCLGASIVLLLLKSVTACPTCPRVEYAGIDAALIGAGVLTLTALVLWLARGERRVPARNAVILGIVAVTLVWQIVAWWTTKLQCLPCGVVSAVLAYVLGSGARWSTDLGQAKLGALPSLINAAVVASVALIVLPGFSFGHAKTQVQALTALGTAKRVVLRHVSEIGLTPTGKRRVLYLAAFNCHACDLGLQSIDTLDVKGVTFLHVGDRPPDLRRRWAPIPDDHLVRSTPTTLFVEKDGRVARQIEGYNGDARAIRDYCNDTQRFLAGP